MELITALYFHLHTPYSFREINFSKTLGWDTTLRFPVKSRQGACL